MTEANFTTVMPQIEEKSMPDPFTFWTAYFEKLAELQRQMIATVNQNWTAASSLAHSQSALGSAAQSNLAFWRNWARVWGMD